MISAGPHHCFLLNYSSRDQNSHFEITLYAITANRTPVKIIINNFRPLFFIPRSTPADFTKKAAERKELPLLGMDGTPVDCLYFCTFAQFSEARDQLLETGVKLYESDIHPVERFLMERFVAGGFEVNGHYTEKNGTLLFHNPVIRGTDVTPPLEMLSIDIETHVAAGTIYSIACCGKSQAVFMIGTVQNNADIAFPITFCRDERALLEAFFDHVQKEDPDILIGWNVIDFDLKMIQSRCNAHSIPFRIGRDSGAKIIESRTSQNSLARIPGRVVLDGPTMLRANFLTFEEYSLNFVASEMLNKTKLIEASGEEKIAEIDRLFIEDKATLAAYNLEDAILTKEIFEKAGILPNAIERTKRSGLLLDRTGGSIAAFDYLYLPRLHRRGYVAHNTTDFQSSTPLPGGYVIEPVPGIYENVLVFDFRSLYPSIIMTFKIDPLGFIAQADDKVTNPAGTYFSKGTTILPEIIEQLMEARAAAKRDNNPYLSQAIKILMNSFYGVLGAQGCRFFSADLASTITKTGQYLLKKTISYISENTPYTVLYGDTDSLFIHLGKGMEDQADQIGKVLSLKITKWLGDHLRHNYQVISHLSLEYQNHFRHFLLPSVRGASYGSKKHYCGSILENGNLNLVFKGMESARSDWTDIAKEFQQELITRVFTGKPVDNYILNIVAGIKRGDFDRQLIYKKRLRKDLQEYTTHVPPHVQAAKLLDSPKHLIRYYITTSGPQPVEKLSAQLDYEHYINSQIRPIADSILEWVGTSFDAIVSGQQDLFGSVIQ